MGCTNRSRVFSTAACFLFASGKAHDGEIEARMTYRCRAVPAEGPYHRDRNQIRFASHCLQTFAPRRFRLRRVAAIQHSARSHAPSPGSSAREQGLIKAPDSLVLGYLQERDRAKVLMSCAAETIMLALSGYESEHLCERLDKRLVGKP